jgi:hypothetical protein
VISGYNAELLLRADEQQETAKEQMSRELRADFLDLEKALDMRTSDKSDSELATPCQG